MSDHRPPDTPTRIPGAVPTDGPRGPLAEHLSGLDERRQQIAIALHYDQDRQSLPTVVASGRGSIAAQILAAAFAAGIKVREDPDLAEILSAVEVDSEIPLEALAAVAEILSYVYRANGGGGAGS